MNALADDHMRWLTHVRQEPSRSNLDELQTAILNELEGANLLPEEWPPTADGVALVVLDSPSTAHMGELEAMRRMRKAIVEQDAEAIVRSAKAVYQTAEHYMKELWMMDELERTHYTKARDLAAEVHDLLDEAVERMELIELGDELRGRAASLLEEGRLPEEHNE